MNTVAQQITESVTMSDIIEHYGLSVNRNQNMMCPFHNEKTASLKIYPGNRGWYCFGCGTGGDVIKFVQKYFSLDFNEARNKINSDFGLCLLESDYRSREKAARAANERMNLMRIQRDKQAHYDRIHLEHTYAFQIYWHIVKWGRPKSMSECPTTSFLNALAQVDRLEDWFENNRTLEQWEANNC